MKKLRYLGMILAVVMLLGNMAMAVVAEETSFAYRNDPRDNPEAMKDIVENPDAVYGFSPNPASPRLGEYADAIDWTDPEQVAGARAQRQEYHDSMSELYRMIEDMLAEARPVEEIARAVSQRRNELRLEAYADDPEGLEVVKKSNLETYGDEMGPSADSLYEKYGSWQTVLEKALGTNPGMDACLGFYDEYYDMYDIEAAENIETAAEEPREEVEPATEEPAEEAEPATEGPGEKASPIYSLDKVVILSRHNIRSPLSGSGSLLGDITPHEWFDWTSNPSELSLRGAILETIMGQYFRLWLEDEGLFPENYQPEDNAVRFYANSKQRTLATAKCFSAGLLPVAQIPIENHVEYDTMDPTFEPSLNFVTDEYAGDVIDQIAEIGGENGFDGILSGLEDAMTLLMDTADIEDSEAYRSGECQDLRSGDTSIILEEGKEPGMTGPIKTATSVADALTLQYYEEEDEKKAAFGDDLTLEDWQLMHSIADTYSEMLFCTPLVSVNVAHPLLEEIRAELTVPDRNFTFLCGHDSNIASVLAAMGAEDYLLPNAVEQHTPIGCKLVFERWLDENDEAFYKVRLVYQSVGQLRGITPLTLEEPPMSYPIRFEGVTYNEDDMLAEEDLLALLDIAIGAYDELEAEYGILDALDDAA